MRSLLVIDADVFMVYALLRRVSLWDDNISFDLRGWYYSLSSTLISLVTFYS